MKNIDEFIDSVVIVDWRYNNGTITGTLKGRLNKRENSMLKGHFYYVVVCENETCSRVRFDKKDVACIHPVSEEDFPTIVVEGTSTTSTT